MSVACGHPNPYPTEDLCPACDLLRNHEGIHGADGCSFCRHIREANEFGQHRAGYLEHLADSLIDDAIALYAAASKTAVEVELQIRKVHAYPPLFDDGTLDGMFARIDELRRMSYAEYLRTPEWAEQRRRARLRADGRCQGCGTAENLETHHSTYERRGQEDPADLTVLCAACHTAIHLVADGRRGKVRKESKRAAR